MVKLKSIYYGGNININKDKNKESNISSIFNLYEKIPINSVMNNEFTEVINPRPLDGTFFFKSVSYQDLSKNLMKTLAMPPKGPIHEHCYCEFCDNDGPQYHAEDCTGPYDYEILTEDGKIFYEKKINSVFSRSELDEIIDSGRDIYYKDIYPNRGVQKFISNNIRNPNFSNVLQIKYSMRDDSGEPIIIPIKVTPYYGITIRNVPFVKDNDFDKFSKFLHKTIINEYGGIPGGIIQDDTWVTNINGIFNVCGETQNIDLEKIFSFIVEFKDRLKEDNGINIYELINSSLKGFITIKFSYSVGNVGIKVQCIIRRGGSVSIFLSYSNKVGDTIHGLSILENKERNVISKDVLQEISDKIYIILFEGLNVVYEKEVSGKSIKDTKIMNTSIPYKVTNDQFKYSVNFKKANFPPQPSGCQNKGISNPSSTTKANIKRPVPFSFSKGKSPTPGMVIKDEGVKSTGAKLIGDRLNLVEPCSEPLAGNTGDNKYIKNVKYSTLTDVISKKKLKRMFDTELIDDRDKLLRYVNMYIAGSTSVREKVFRRTLFGFPNNLFSEDSGEYNNIKKGNEIIPKLKEGEAAKDNIPLKDTQMVVQRDINSAVYVPGTQLANFDGNNKLIRDYREYPGLMKFTSEKYKSLLLSIANNYIDSLVVIDNIPKPIPVNKSFLSTLNNNYIMTLTPQLSNYEKIKQTNNEFIGYVSDDTFYVCKSANNNPFEYTGNIKSVVYPYEIHSLDFNEEYEQLIFIDKTTGVIYEYGKNVSWYFRNSTIEFHVEIDKSYPKGLVKLSFVNGKQIPHDIAEELNLFEFGGNREYLFIPPREYRKINDSGIYKFTMNWYIDNDKYYRLIPNQPFILVDDYEIVDKKEVFKTVKKVLQDDYTQELLFFIYN